MPDLLERLKNSLAGRYAIESEIGRGGMATVFLAEDLKHHRKVAIKVLHPELTASLGADRFLNEIQIAAGLTHPHILSLIDSGEADGLPYYVMPYVEGESLRERLDREGELPVEEAVRIAVEVADGLQHAHERGVVHRDVKPGNVLLSGKHAVVADFGIARAVTAAQQGRMTGTGLGVGTPLYASPEQATGAETLDGRTDVYSLGCVLYEMLTGEVPLSAPTPQAVQARRLTETPVPIHPQRETVPPLLDQVVAKALAKRPADRWESPEAFGRALLTATMEATPVARAELAHVLGGEAPEAAFGPRWRRWRWALLAGAVATVAVGVWLEVRQAASRTAGAGHDGIVVAGAGPAETKLELEGRVGYRLQFGAGAFAIAPDGEHLAYCSSDEDGVHRLWLADLSSVDRRHEVLAVGTACSWVLWTPSGDHVHFLGAIGGQWGRYVVSRHGGGVTFLTDCPDLNDQYPYDGKSLLLSPDGSRMAFANPQRRDMRVLPTGSCEFDRGDSVLVGGEYDVMLPQAWSPHGDRILVTTVTGKALELKAIEIDGTSQTTIATDGGLWPVWWSDEGRTLFYTRTGAYERGPDWTHGSLKVMRQPLSPSAEPEGPPQSVPYFDRDPVDWFSMSSDGRTAVVAREDNRYRFVRVVPDPDPDTREAAVVPIIDPISGEGWAPFTWDAPRRAKGFDLSPDGAWIIHPREVEGGSDLFKTPVAGGEPQRMTRTGNVYGGVWSPDGRFVAYFSPWQDTVRIWLAAADGRSSGPILGVAPLVAWGMTWVGADLVYRRTDLEVEVLTDLELEYGQWSGQTWRPVDAAEGAVPTSTFVVKSARRLLVPNARLERWQSAGETLRDSLEITGFIGLPHASPGADRLLMSWTRFTGPEPLGEWWWLISNPNGLQTPLTPINPDEGPVGWTQDGKALYWQSERDLFVWPLGGEKSHLMTLPENLHGCHPRPDIDGHEFVCMLDESSVELFLVENFNRGQFRSGRSSLPQE
ncbi:MAG: protein kinase [marine benthic group bacterium]|nr:protein kinase [Gemmatimonadota bacterium]